MKKVCFILKSFSFYPTGGTKMIFEYANRLVNDGYKVQILYLNDEALLKYHIPEKLREKIVSLLNLFSPNWFKLDRKIERLSFYDHDLKKKIEDTDIMIVTSLPTVNISIQVFNDKKFIYYIQGFENWTVSDEVCYETYNLGLNNVVVAEWLKNIVEFHSSGRCTLIKNPIDITIYKMNIPLNGRKKHSIGVLYHEMSNKGFKYAWEAIGKLKNIYNDLEVYMFGVPRRPKNFPQWVHYKQKASKYEVVEIYNKIQVFLCASIEEGFGLTGLEAMACGAALVSTEYLGVKEYAENNKNALLSEIKNSDALVNNVVRLFENNELRYHIAMNGIESVKKFSWDVALKKFEKLINECE